MTELFHNSDIESDEEIKKDLSVLPFKSGVLSQWHQCKFTVGDLTFSSAEQWMMYQKAMLFGDNEIAEQIMKVNNCMRIKALGRKVHGFNPKVWNTRRFQIVIEGNIHKFSNSVILQKALIDTNYRTLVEGSRTDAIWGVGLDSSDPRCLDKTKWRGMNLLGKALEVVREELRKN